MILAIDPSLTGTAIAHGDGQACAIERFSSENQGDHVAARIRRYEWMLSHMLAFLQGRDFKAVFIEAYTYQQNDARAKFAVELGGLLRWHLTDFTPVIYEVSPTTLKKFVTGKGSGKKELLAAHCVKRWGVMFDTSDEYDAYGLYRLGLVVEGLEEPANQAQQEAAAVVASQLSGER